MDNQHAVASLCPLCRSESATQLWQEGPWDLVQCDSCEHVYVSNPPDDEELRRLYSFDGGFHTELASGPADAGDAMVQRAAQVHLDLMSQVQPPGKLLDVGCATGKFMAAAATRGWEVSGVELNDDTASIARADGLDVVTGTLQELPIPDPAFDAVTMWDVIEHVTDPVALLTAAGRMLGPGGWLWLATPNVDGLFPQASLKVAHRVGAWPHPEPPYHLSQFSERTIHHALARAGFRDVVVTHRRIPLSYTFGSPRKVAVDPKRLAYTAVFAPLALIGPVVGRGDTLVLRARLG
jgi:2-polyprenyl-3-methyl-5-hydroxy-6-metoxy-1,4-benzoquinol methylase/Zn ribbon nucleic-acid-binding protein